MFWCWARTPCANICFLSVLKIMMIDLKSVIWTFRISKGLVPSLKIHIFVLCQYNTDYRPNSSENNLATPCQATIKLNPCKFLKFMLVNINSSPLNHKLPTSPSGSELDCQTPDWEAVGGHWFDSQPNPSSDLLSISLLISEKLHINN